VKHHKKNYLDVCRSNDGSMLVVSSTDGYCSLVQFSDNELGAPYKLTVKEVLDKPIITQTSTTNLETPDNTGNSARIQPLFSSSLHFFFLIYFTYTLFFLFLSFFSPS